MAKGILFLIFSLVISNVSMVFLSPITRRKALRLLKKGFVHFLGSDCHDMETRPPRIGPAYKLLEKKLDADLFRRFVEFGYNFVR